MYMKYIAVFLVVAVLFSGLAVAMVLELHKPSSSSDQSQSIGNTSVKMSSKSVEFKVLHGVIADNSSEVGGVYYTP